MCEKGLHHFIFVSLIDEIIVCVIYVFFSVPQVQVVIFVMFQDRGFTSSSNVIKTGKAAASLQTPDAGMYSKKVCNYSNILTESQCMLFSRNQKSAVWVLW